MPQRRRSRRKLSGARPASVRDRPEPGDYITNGPNRATGSVRIRIDTETGEILVASGRSILRTVLGGTRLKENGCSTLTRTERIGSQAYCMRLARLSPLHLRVSAVPNSVPSIPVPTDSLYKFAALFGLVLIDTSAIACNVSYNSTHAELTSLAQKYIDIELKLSYRCTADAVTSRPADGDRKREHALSRIFRRHRLSDRRSFLGVGILQMAQAPASSR